MWTFLWAMAALFMVVAWLVSKASAKPPKLTAKPVEVGIQPPPPQDLKSQPQEDRDSYEGHFGSAPEQRSIKKRVQIDYRDGNGNPTTRAVDIQKFEPSGADGMVLGWCHLRGARRTLRFDRMARVVDLETGEIIPDLQATLNAEWAASTEPVLDRLFSEHNDALKLLLYAAKADGAMRAKELEVIAKLCADLSGDRRITPAKAKELMAYVELPTERSFTLAYNRLRRDQPDVAHRVAQACREIVDTQTSMHPVEQAMLAVLDKPLPKAG